MPDEVLREGDRRGTDGVQKRSSSFTVFTLLILSYLLFCRLSSPLFCSPFCVQRPLTTFLDRPNAQRRSASPESTGPDTVLPSVRRKPFPLIHLRR